jgi:hypothetical protein
MISLHLCPSYVYGSGERISNVWRMSRTVILLGLAPSSASSYA